MGDGVNVNVWSPEVMMTGVDTPVGMVKVAPEVVTMVCPREFVDGRGCKVEEEEELLGVAGEGVKVSV